MEKLDEDSAAKFINALIKSVQTLCHGYLEFNNGIEIIGHLNLSVDKGSSLHYILEEKVCKNEENSTLFISNSFHAQNQKSDAKSKGKDSDAQSGSRSEEKTSSSDLGEAGKLSAISSISSALSKSHEKNRSGSTSSTKDSEHMHSKPSSSTAKRKASDDHSNDIRAAKSSHLTSSPSPVSHFLSHSPHDPSGSSSPVDTKPSFRQLHSEDSAGTVLPQTAAVTSDNASDLGVNLAGSVLERVDDHSNSDLPDRGEDSDGDLEVTFIKEEYVEGEQSACQFDNSGGQQYGRGTHQRASSSDMSDGSMYPVSLHHSQSASSTFVPSAQDMAAVQHYGGPSTSGQPQPGTSGVRGNLSSHQPPQPMPEGVRPGCGYIHHSDAQKWMQRRRPSQELTRPLMPPPPPPPLPPPPPPHMGPPRLLVAASTAVPPPPDIHHHRHDSPSATQEDIKPHNFLHPPGLDSSPGRSTAASVIGAGSQNFLNVSSGLGGGGGDHGQPIRMTDTPSREDPIKRLAAMVDRQLMDPGPAVRLTDW